MTKLVTRCDLCGKEISRSTCRFRGQLSAPENDDTISYLGNYIDVCLDCLSRGILKCQDGICYSDTGEWTNVHKNPDTEQTS